MNIPLAPSNTAAGGKVELDDKERALGQWLDAVGQLFTAMGRPEVLNESPVEAVAAIIVEAAERLRRSAEAQTPEGGAVVWQVRRKGQDWGPPTTKKAVADALVAEGFSLRALTEAAPGGFQLSNKQIQALLPSDADSWDFEEEGSFEHEPQSKPFALWRTQTVCDVVNKALASVPTYRELIEENQRLHRSGEFLLKEKHKAQERERELWDQMQAMRSASAESATSSTDAPAASLHAWTHTTAELAAIYGEMAAINETATKDQTEPQRARLKVLRAEAVAIGARRYDIAASLRSDRGAAPPNARERTVKVPEGLGTSDAAFWLDKRGQIISALRESGLSIVTAAHGVSVMRLGSLEGRTATEPAST